MNFESVDMKATASFETSGTIYPETQRHIPEGRNPRLYAAKTSQLEQTALLHFGFQCGCYISVDRPSPNTHTAILTFISLRVNEDSNSHIAPRDMPKMYCLISF